jgi:hypothetical protein
LTVPLFVVASVQKLLRRANACQPYLNVTMHLTILLAAPPTRRSLSLPSYLLRNSRLRREAVQIEKNQRPASIEGRWFFLCGGKAAACGKLKTSFLKGTNNGKSKHTI